MCVAFSLALLGCAGYGACVRRKFKDRPRPARLSADWWFVSLALAPSPGEFRAMLADLRRVFPGRELPNVLGVSSMTLEAWAMGIRKPTSPARRMVWLVWCLVLHPSRLQTVFDLATWGRFRRDRKRRQRSARQSFRQFIPPMEDWSI